MKFSRLIQTLCLAVGLFSASAQASLVGDTINASGNFLAPASATIGVGAEFNFANGYVLFDFGASTLTIKNTIGNLSWGDFGYYTFSGFDDTITGLSIASNNGFAGDPLSSFSFNAHSITLHWGNGSATPNAQLVFNINAVPEPESLLLVGTALLAALGLRRRMV
jgi:hypothetical protein